MKQKHSNTAANIAAVRLAVSIGFEIQNLFPQIADEYVGIFHEGRYEGGKTLRELIMKYGLVGRFSIYESTGDFEKDYRRAYRIAETALIFAIRGYNNSLYNAGDSYEGLEEKSVLDEVAFQRKSDAGKKNGKEAYLRKDGVHAMSKSDRLKAVHKGHRAMGNTLYSKKELLIIFTYAKEECFWHKQHGEVRIKSAVISRILNRIFHGGKRVRGDASIRGLFNRIRIGRKKLPKFLRKQARKILIFKAQLKKAL